MGRGRGNGVKGKVAAAEGLEELCLALPGVSARARRSGNAAMTLTCNTHGDDCQNVSSEANAQGPYSIIVARYMRW